MKVDAAECCGDGERWGSIAEGMPHLFTRRGRYVGPHRLLEAIEPVLFEIVALLDAISRITGDIRWSEIADKFTKARDGLLAPSDEELRLRARANEERLLQETLRAIRSQPQLLEAVRKLPLKPMVRVILREPKLLAAKLRRRR